MANALTFLKRSALCLPALALLGGASADGAPAAQAAKKPAVTAACSVHLCYRAPPATAFYNEITVEKSAHGSFFMACGFEAGYFGMQELGDGRKVVIFSVWDAGSGNNPNAAAKDKRVEVRYKADDVHTERFGGEGTGQKSMWGYDWKVGQTCRFLVKIVSVDGKPAYAAYFFVPETKAWKHLATFWAPGDIGLLKDYDSFVEDFRRDTRSVGETRRAVFGNGAVCDETGAWRMLNNAYFEASEAPTEAREKIDAGPVANGFFLQNGGDTQMHTKVHALMERPVAVTMTDLPKD